MVKKFAITGLEEEDKYYPIKQGFKTEAAAEKHAINKLGFKKREEFQIRPYTEIEEKKIGKYSKSKYWIHKQPNWGLKGRKMRW